LDQDLLLKIKIKPDPRSAHNKSVAERKSSSKTTTSAQQKSLHSIALIIVSATLSPKPAHYMARRF